MANGNGPPSEWKTARFWLAIGFSGMTLLGVIVMSIVIVRYAADKTEAARTVFNAILPLLGTWVGTILAFYFSKENFEAATKSVTDLASKITPQEKLKSTPVKDVMITKDQMFVKTVPADQINLDQALRELDSSNKGNRIPVLTSDGRPVYVVHRSLIDKFLSQEARKPKPRDPKTLTLQDMLDEDPQVKRIAEAFDTVREDANLSDAKEKMDLIPDCQDIFVTKAGTKTEPLIGWITNVIVQQNSKV